MSRNSYILIFILVLFAFTLWTVVPIESERFGRKGISLGLDLKGGSHLVYEADLTKKDPSQSDAEAMEAVKDTVERRVNAYGVTEPTVQIQGSNRLLVQLPGLKNIDEALKLIGKTAQLDFREGEYDASGKLITDENSQPKFIPAKGTGDDGQEKELTGKYFKPNAHAVVSPNGEPEVSFEWNPEGARLFEQVTRRNLQKPLAIYLDNELISAPTVQAVIKDKGVITGIKLEEARLLSAQLNSGALTLPLKLIQQMNVDATLGEDSLRKSLIAGAIGVFLVILFMAIYYRMPGLAACGALTVYGVLLLSIFKLIPVTLTLPGVAGFIVSLGMAVDGNVLTFERLKEELRAGRTPGAAVEESFRRSWTAIWDSNITTFIACGVLFWLGGTFGAFMVRGFAVTLFLGNLISMFTIVTVTRTFLRLIISSGFIKNLQAYGVIK